MKNIYVLTDHMELCKDGECVTFLSAEGQKSKESLGLIESIMLMGNAQITSQAMRACLQRHIPIYHTTLSGRLLGISSPFQDGFLKRRMNQYAVCSDFAYSLTIAKAFVHAKTVRQLQMLLLARKKIADFHAVQQCFLRYQQAIQTSTDMNMLLGVEGSIAKAYFGTFPMLLCNQAWNGRSKRPALDEVNALLNLGYMMALCRISSCCIAAGLDPALGFLHQIELGRPSLACDFLELFRSVIDHFVISCFNRKELLDTDFEHTSQGLQLQKSAFPKWVGKFREVELMIDREMQPHIQQLLTALERKQPPLFEKAYGVFPTR